MRRLCLLISALLVPLLPAAPAYAATNVICVGTPVGTCNQNADTIPLAITAAGIDGMDSVILVGPGTYDDGPYQITTANTVLQGSGPGNTVLTLPDNPIGQAYLTITTSATVSDLTIDMEGGGNSLNDVGLIAVNGAVVDGVTIDGTATQAAQGAAITDSTLTGSSVLLPLTSGRAVFAQGGNTVTDSTLTGSQGYGFSSSGVDTLSRVTIRTGGTGLGLDSGTVNIDNSVIDLGSFVGTALQASNNNVYALPKTVNADHLTIVGGTGSSRGVWANASAPAAIQTTTINLSNSIVRGPAESLRADASNLGQPGTSTATINVSYSDFGTTIANSGANGTAEISVGDPGNVQDIDPLFVDAAAGDYRLRPGSPVVDQGDPTPGASVLDRDSNVRVFDGDAVAGAVRDMGAYELTDLTAPETAIDSGPSGPTGDATPAFAFSSEPDATFECQVDAGGFAACSSPFTTSSLGDGPHTFSVRAIDSVTNVDASPATRAFTVDTLAPDTTLTSGPTSPTNDATPTFAFSSESGATFKCQVDAGAFVACSSPFTTSSLGNGPHTFSVRAVDAAANVDASPATRAFTVDTLAPDTTFTRTPGKTVFSRRVRFRFTSNEAGVTFECKKDAKAYQPCTSPLRWRVKLGKHVLRVRAVDAAGNVDPTPARYRFKRLPQP